MWRAFEDPATSYVILDFLDPWPSFVAVPASEAAEFVAVIGAVCERPVQRQCGCGLVCLPTAPKNLGCTFDSFPFSDGSLYVVRVRRDSRLQ